MHGVTKSIILRAEEGLLRLFRHLEMMAQNIMARVYKFGVDGRRLGVVTGRVGVLGARTSNSHFKTINIAPFTAPKKAVK